MVLENFKVTIMARKQYYVTLPWHLIPGRTRDSGQRRRGSDTKESTEFTLRVGDNGYRPSKDEGFIRGDGNKWKGRV